MDVSDTKDPLLTAIDALAVELGIGKDGLSFTWDQLEALNGILAVHAHELAEKIRADAHGHKLVSYERLAAADLIDPEHDGS